MSMIGIQGVCVQVFKLSDLRTAFNIDLASE